MTRDDFYASPFGVAYSAYMERPRLSRAISRTMWGGDTKPYYESMGAVAEVGAGGLIVDCPCGAGPALRALPADGSVRYLGVDLSPSMLRRAEKRAAARALKKVELTRADATEIPLPDAAADLLFSFWGLHCFPDPAAALIEAARVLRPGGRIVGATFLRGEESLRQRLLVRPHSQDFGPVGSESEVREWLRAAGLRLSDASRSGPMLFFDARRD
jgi:ubiquinone/menaquinone biosynthesis C-methylase UbiE